MSEEPTTWDAATLWDEPQLTAFLAELAEDCRAVLRHLARRGQAPEDAWVLALGIAVGQVYADAVLLAGGRANGADWFARWDGG